MSFRTYIRALALLTGAVYAALIWTGATAVIPEAGGMWPFDLRATGYTPSEATAFLAALSADGRAAYLGPVAMLDTLFPPLLGLLLASLIWRWRSRKPSRRSSEYSPMQRGQLTPSSKSG